VLLALFSYEFIMQLERPRSETAKISLLQEAAFLTFFLLQLLFLMKRIGRPVNLRTRTENSPQISNERSKRLVQMANCRSLAATYFVSFPVFLLAFW